MNLKEAFRYQKFLDTLMHEASISITNPDHCLTTTKTHMRKEANPEAEDFVETVDREDFVCNNAMIEFMEHLVYEREKLSTAIGAAKNTLGFDIDAAVETNKFRQMLSNSIRTMMRNTPYNKKVQDIGYKFDVNGAQVTYRYDVYLSVTDDYDRSKAKNVMRNMSSAADTTSADIDSAMINADVKYDPPYNVNESFDDVLDTFINGHS